MQAFWLAKLRLGAKRILLNLNAREQRIYRLELELIRKYFKGLRPRPVKLARIPDLGADSEAGEPNLVLKDHKRSRQELEALLKHELIHYQLKDRGNVYHGHGAAFLRRAQELGIVNSYVLQRCFSAEEFEHIPTVRKAKRIPLAKFKRQVGRWFEQLLAEVGRLPPRHSVVLYPYVQNDIRGVDHLIYGGRRRVGPCRTGDLAASKRSPPQKPPRVTNGIPRIAATAPSPVKKGREAPKAQ